MLDTRLVHFSVSSPVRIDTGTMAMSGWSGQGVVLLEPRAQPAGADRHHDVVHGGAERVLDVLDERERRGPVGEAAVRA